MTSIIGFILAGLAALAAGAINALAGGGTLITFPALVALGIPAVAANITNTVALSPGYLGGTLAQSKDLQGQEKRLWLMIPAGVVGGIIGGVLLLYTGEKIFRSLVPFLILLASGLLAIQDPLRAWLLRRAEQNKAHTPSEKWAMIPVGLAAIYGGYFGAGLSVIVLAVLGLVIEDSLTRLNATKQAVGFAVNVSAAIFFLFSGKVVWPVAIVMAIGALLGGVLGGKLAGRVKPATLRWIVVAIGVVVSIIYFVRG
ncbi:MAG: sulfite exporter TauE/SafE family protein [Chloroflexi bacterium]|nr:sulfite exporter TauE/SafE family protein [Chloroflexota bacterium]MBI3340334.1 sulfite exporter TauE/SafE family protein [Chloroflexota bacterium]